MQALVLDIAVDDPRLSLRGGVDLVTRNRRLWIFLEHYLGAIKVGPNEIDIPIAAGSSVGAIVGQIEEALKRHQLNLSRSSALTESISGFLAEEERFREFSGRARAIWNNEIPTEELAGFTSTIQRE